VTLALDAVVVAGGIFFGRLVMRVLRERKARQSADSGDGGESGDPARRRSGPSPGGPASSPPARGEGSSPSSRSSRSDAAGQPATSRSTRPESSRSSRPPRPGDPEILAGFVCKLGDVIVRRVEGDDAWLAGALVFSEEQPVAALFIAPDTDGGRAVLVPGPSQSTLTWLGPLEAARLQVAGEPPRALEHAGTHFERTRRLPVRVQRLGEGAPQIGVTAIVAEYAGRGPERLVVVVGVDGALAWRGVSLTEEEYDVLPGGASTLDT
jgi:hypothetical protein